MEKSIKESSLKQIFEILKTSIWQLNIKTGKLLINENLTNILGYISEEIESFNIKKFKILIHPDDYEKTIKTIRQFFKDKNNYLDFESRINIKMVIIYGFVQEVK